MMEEPEISNQSGTNVLSGDKGPMLYILYAKLHNFMNFFISMYYDSHLDLTPALNFRLVCLF